MLKEKYFTYFGYVFMMVGFLIQTDAFIWLNTICILFLLLSIYFTYIQQNIKIQNILIPCILISAFMVKGRYFLSYFRNIEFMGLKSVIEIGFNYTFRELLIITLGGILLIVPQLFNKGDRV